MSKHIIRSHESRLEAFERGAREAGREISNSACGGFDDILMAEAEFAAKRARKGPKYEKGAAASAILCAAAGCEAALSERLNLNIGFHGDRRYESIRDMKIPSRRWNAFLKMAAPHFNSGGSKEYQALDCLFQLRNHVAHRHARFLKPGSWPEGLSGFIRRGTLPVKKQEAMDWMYLALTKTVARWAFLTGKNWLKLVEKLAPYAC